MRFLQLAVAVVVIGMVLATGEAMAGAQQYLNPAFASLTAGHKQIAILPFKVTIDTKRLKNVSLEVIRQNERDEATAFQRQLYTRMLQKSADEGYTVGFQDVDRTIALMQKAGISVDSMSFLTKDEIAKILGVDALLSGSINQSAPTSQGMALAQSFLIGAHGSTQRVDISIVLHNGADGALLWSYDHTDSGGGMTGSLSNSVEAMVKSLLKKVAGNFPYRSRK